MVTKLIVVPNCCRTVKRKEKLPSCFFCQQLATKKSPSSHFMLHTGIPAPLGQNRGLSEFNSQPNGVADNLLETLVQSDDASCVQYHYRCSRVLGQCYGQKLHIPKQRQPQQRGDPGAYGHAHVLLPDDAKRELKVGTLLLWMAEHKSSIVYLYFNL